MSMHSEDWKALGDKIEGWIKDHPWQAGCVLALGVGVIAGMVFMRLAGF